MPKKLIILFAILILFLTLFPFGWLGTLSPTFDALLDWLFPEPWGHFFGHGFMFIGVGLALLLTLPKLRQRFWLYVPLVMLVAVGQEFFQLLYKQRPIGLNDLTDLIPDVLGATTVFTLFHLLIQLRKSFVVVAEPQP